MPLNYFHNYDPKKCFEINYQWNDIDEEFQDDDENSTIEEVPIDIPYNPNDYYDLINIYNEENVDSTDGNIYNDQGDDNEDDEGYFLESSNGSSDEESEVELRVSERKKRYYLGSDSDDSERTHSPSISEILEMDSDHVDIVDENDEHVGVFNMGAHWFDPRVDVRKYYYYKGVDKTFGKAWNGMSITQMKEYIEKIIYEVMFCLPKDYKVEVYTFLDPHPDKEKFFYFMTKTLWTEIGTVQIEVATNDVAHVFLRIEDEVLDEMPVDAFV